MRTKGVKAIEPENMDDFWEINKSNTQIAKARWNNRQKENNIEENVTNKQVKDAFNIIQIQLRDIKENSIKKSDVSGKEIKEGLIYICKMLQHINKNIDNNPNETKNSNT